MQNKLRRTCCSIGFLALSACASMPDGNALDNVKVSNVEVEQEQPFDVKMARTQMSSAAPMFGLIGMGIDAASRSSSDATLADSFAPALKTSDFNRIFEDKLRQELLQAKRFAPQSVTMNAKTSSETPAILMVKIQEWGLRHCMSGNFDEQMQIVIKAEGILKSTQNKSTLWTKEVTQIEPDCYLLEKFRDQHGLLSSSLSRSFNSLAVKIVNELLYP